MGFSSLVLTADAVICSLIGVFFYFAPHIIGDFIFNRVTDGIHWHLIRCVGGQLIGGAFISWMFRNRHPRTQTVCNSIKVMASILLLFFAFHAASTTPQLIDLQMLKMVRYSLWFSLVVHFLILIYRKWEIGSTVMPNAAVANGLYQLDTIAAIVIGVAWMADPIWLLHKQVLVPLDASHALCGRVMGALFVCSMYASQQALHWTVHADRNCAADARIVTCVAILGAQIWSQIAYLRDWSEGHWTGIALFSIWTVIAVFYRIFTAFTAGSEKKKN